MLDFLKERSYLDSLQILSEGSQKKDIISIRFLQTSIGIFILGATQEDVCMIEFMYRRSLKTQLKSLKTISKKELVYQNSPLFEEVGNQIQEYIEKERQEFRLPILFFGTDFQKKVWEELKKIKYGETKSYLYLSEKLGDKNLVRAVANANGKNRLSIVIPCHRIIGHDGTLVGYAGGLQVKKKLLGIESPTKKQKTLFDE